MNKTNIYDHKPLQERQDTSPVRTNSALSLERGQTNPLSKRNDHCRGENTCVVDRTRPDVGKYTVFVLSPTNKPLTPTTKAKARKLLKANEATIVWSKFNEFGIKLVNSTREIVPNVSLGVDNGTKFEGYSIVCDKTNNLNVKLDLPNKKNIVRKLKERNILRRNRRNRLRRRPKRIKNRNHKGFIAPSQMIIVNSRLKIIKELFKMYPINLVGFEDVRFNHAKKKWGSNFSTVEIGKSVLFNFFESKNAKVFKFKGYETKAFREKYSYKKTSSKSIDKFESHCCDSLALAIEVNNGERLEPGKFIVVDDTYRCVRRKLHDTLFKVGGIKEKYSTGIVFGLRKGLLVCSTRRKVGQLCGSNRDKFIFYGFGKIRQNCKKLAWISSNFIMIIKNKNDR